MSSKVSSKLGKKNPSQDNLYTLPSSWISEQWILELWSVTATLSSCLIQPFLNLVFFSVTKKWNGNKKSCFCWCTRDSYFKFPLYQVCPTCSLLTRKKQPFLCSHTLLVALLFGTTYMYEQLFSGTKYRKSTISSEVWQMLWELPLRELQPLPLNQADVLLPQKQGHISLLCKKNSIGESAKTCWAWRDGYLTTDLLFWHIYPLFLFRVPCACPWVSKSPAEVHLHPGCAPFLPPAQRCALHTHRRRESASQGETLYLLNLLE